MIFEQSRLKKSFMSRDWTTETYIYAYKTDCLYLCPPFTWKLPDQSPPNFEQTSTLTRRRFLTPPTRPPDSWVTQTPKPQQITGKKLCFTKNVQMGDLISLNFSRATPGPGWLVYNILQIVWVAMWQTLWNFQDCKNTFCPSLHYQNRQILFGS